MAQPLTVVIFGASGDLTWRKLIPALFNLAQKGKMPPEAQIVGVARTEYTDETYREYLKEKVKSILPGEQFSEETWAAFAPRIHYVATDATQPGGSRPLAAWFAANEREPNGRRLYYFSVVARSTTRRSAPAWPRRA